MGLDPSPPPLNIVHLHSYRLPHTQHCARWWVFGTTKRRGETCKMSLSKCLGKTHFWWPEKEKEKRKKIVTMSSKRRLCLLFCLWPERNKKEKKQGMHPQNVSGRRYREHGTRCWLLLTKKKGKKTNRQYVLGRRHRDHGNRYDAFVTWSQTHNNERRVLYDVFPRHIAGLSFFI